MLIIWTGAKQHEIKELFGTIIGPQNVPHRIHSDMNTVPEPEEGDVILACGSKAMAHLQSLGLVPKNRTITSMREKEIKVDGASIFVTFDPSIISRDYARLPDLMWDCQLACRVVLTGSTRPDIGTYRYVDSLHELIERIEQKYAETGKVVDVACDLETKGLDEYEPNAWIIACSFTVDEGKSDVLYFERGEMPEEPPPFVDFEDMDYWGGLWTQIHWVLTSEKVSIRGANFKFDSRWLNQKWGIYCTNHKFDTLLVGSLLDENRSNSLKLHAKVMTAMGGYEDDMDKYDFSELEKVPKEELLDYVGGDTDATYRVAKVMKSQLTKQKRLANFYIHLAHPSSKVFEKMERNGILVDVPYYHALQTELEAEAVRLEHDMVSMLPAKLRSKHKDRIDKAFADNKNPMTPAVLKDFLFTKEGLGLKPKMKTEKTGEPSTSLDHLMMFEDNPDAINFISLFREYGSATKTLSTYVVGFLKHLRSDGRFHPHFMLFRGGYGGDDDDAGTVTGRTSAKDPAVQTIPKHTKWTKRLRRALIAPEGMTILQCDYSQGELKIAACVADEPTMINAYRNGIDLHAITAAQLNGYELEEFMLLPEDQRDSMRSSGKAGNFGLLYGMGAAGFKSYAYTSYGVTMTEEEAHQKRDAFFSLYSQLPVWHEDSRAFARKNGYVTSPLGRVRHLPLINSKESEIRAQSERQSINSPIQSTLSDLMQLAMVQLDREYGQEQVQMFLMTHDSIAFYIPIGEEKVWARRITDTMANLPIKELFGWQPQLQFTADAEAAVADESGVYSLAGLKKLKGF